MTLEISVESGSEKAMVVAWVRELTTGRDRSSFRAFDRPIFKLGAKPGIVIAIDEP